MSLRVYIYLIFPTICCSVKSFAQGCITPQGTLTGSTVCRGMPPSLTFSATVGIGPFAISYTNGTTNYTQNNVQSGIPFPVPDLPQINTTYTLTSIQDASGCPPIQVTGLSVGANLIVNGDFSGGNSGFISTYTYDPVNVTDGEYFIGTDPVAWNAGMTPCHDHTTGTGNMMLVNGSVVAGVGVWTETIPVTPNTDYEFSTWVQTITTLNPGILQFAINGIEVGNLFNANNSSCIWDRFYTTWNSGGLVTATISILNMNQAYSGNDFALDDISFAPITATNNSTTVSVENPKVLASPDISVCPGKPVQLSAVGALTYSWLPASGLSDPAIADPIALPIVTTSYIVTGITAKKCVAKDTVVVAIYAPTLAILTPDTSICAGSPAQLRAFGGNIYTWSPAQYLDDPGIADPVAQPAVTTIFFLNATDNNLCTELDSVTVSIRPRTLFQKPGDLSVCSGFSGTLKSANDPDDKYAWSPAGTLSDPNSPAPVASPDVTTAYTLQISDAVCAIYDSTFSVTVNVKPSPVVVASKANDINCTQPTTQLTASGASIFVWSPANGLSDPRIADPLVSIDTTTTYIVQGTDRNGCSGTDTLTVFVTATGKNLFVVPNAFSPNGDGHNDCFGIRRWGDVTIEEFSVYNRNGQRIFTTRNPSDCWDGTFRGKPQEAGAYAFVIKGWSFCGQVTRTGTVVLVR